MKPGPDEVAKKMWNRPIPHTGLDADGRVWWNSRRLARLIGYRSNADQKKPIVKTARDYFMSDMTSPELATGVEGNVLIYRSSTGKVNVSVLFNNETFWISQQ